MLRGDHPSRSIPTPTPHLSPDLLLRRTSRHRIGCRARPPLAAGAMSEPDGLAQDRHTSTVGAGSERDTVNPHLKLSSSGGTRSMFGAR